MGQVKPLSKTIGARETRAHTDHAGRLNLTLPVVPGQKSCRKRAITPGSVVVRLYPYSPLSYVETTDINGVFPASINGGIVSGTVDYETGDLAVVTTFAERVVEVLYRSPRDDAYQGRQPKTVHKLHALMAEVNDCAPKPKPRERTRKFTFDE